MKYTYLLIDFFTLFFPFILSFHPRSNFYQTWKIFFPAVLITGLLFVLWDMYFTKLGVWGFNPNYIIGVRIGNLPIEEILFFFCIPYACVFTYACFRVNLKITMSKRGEVILSNLIIIISLCIGFIYIDRKYTTVTFFLLAILHIIAIYILKINWHLRFYMVYGVLLIPFLIVNGLLTGTGLNAPVVWYNNAEIIGIRILTIPVEDVFYGMDLIFVNLLIFLTISSSMRRHPAAL